MSLRFSSSAEELVNILLRNDITLLLLILLHVIDYGLDLWASMTPLLATITSYHFHMHCFLVKFSKHITEMIYLEM